MRVKVKNKYVIIPDNEIEKSMEKLDLTKEEAIKMWLDDNEYEINEEQKELDTKASKIRNNQDVIMANMGQPRKVKKPIASEEKQALFDTILKNLDRCEYVNRENVTVLRENKLLEVKIGTKVFKIDVIETRTPKK